MNPKRRDVVFRAEDASGVKFKAVDASASDKKHQIRIASISNELWRFLEDIGEENGLGTASATARFLLVKSMREYQEGKHQ